jgi:hypothetical protein
MNEPFNDITPPESLLREHLPGGRFAVAGFRGRLYVAEIVYDEHLFRDRCRVLGYDFDQGRWHTILEVFGESGAAPAPVPPSVRIIALREPGAAEETLFLRFASPIGSRLLRLAADDSFETLAGPDRLIDAWFDFSAIADLGGQLFGLGMDEGGWAGRIVAYRPESEIWQPMDLPPLAEGGKRSVGAITGFAGALYAATVDGERGFDLWRQDPDEAEPAWKPVFERGAWRYAQNREAFTMVHHGGALYLVTGTGEGERKPESKFLDYQGFELIRIAADSTWDLLVGVPRVSPSGLLVPFSGLGAGMHAGLRLEYRTCLSLGGRLILGLHSINGLQLRESVDGEAWTPLAHPELAAIHQVHACRAIPSGEHLALVMQISDALGNEATQIWAGRTRAGAGVPG